MSISWESSLGCQLCEDRDRDGPLYHSPVTRSQQSCSSVYPTDICRMFTYATNSVHRMNKSSPHPRPQGAHSLAEEGRASPVLDWVGSLPKGGRGLEEIRASHPSFGLLRRTCTLFLVMVLVPKHVNKSCLLHTYTPCRHFPSFASQGLTWSGLHGRLLADAPGTSPTRLLWPVAGRASPVQALQ